MMNEISYRGCPLHPRDYLIGDLTLSPTSGSQTTSHRVELQPMTLRPLSCPKHDAFRRTPILPLLENHGHALLPKNRFSWNRIGTRTQAGPKEAVEAHLIPLIPFDFWFLQK